MLDFINSIMYSLKGVRVPLVTLLTFGPVFAEAIGAMIPTTENR